MAGVEPLHQRAARVEADLQSFVSFKDVKERQVAVLVRLLEDSVEVADWLMVVQDEHKAQRLIHGGVKWAGAARGRASRFARRVRIVLYLRVLPGEASCVAPDYANHGDLERPAVGLIGTAARGNQVDPAY